MSSKVILNWSTQDNIRYTIKINMQDTNNLNKVIHLY